MSETEETKRALTQNARIAADASFQSSASDLSVNPSFYLTFTLIN
jgi:hypothetical protein